MTMNPYIQLPTVPLLNNRQNIILEHCTGKRVLHLGCVDAGLLQERFERGELLHQKLASVASELWGFDIDEEGISFLKEQGFDNLFSGDASEINHVKPLMGINFDIIVAAEIVEHLQNPGLFLQTVKHLMTLEETTLIITVPNAFRIDTLLKLIRNVEYIHPDHNYWFSYHTITNLLRKNGFTVSQVYVYAFSRVGIVPEFIKKIFRPNTAHTEEQSLSSSVNNPLSAPSIPLFQKISSYFISLPRRSLNTFLYSKTPFWGDGIIVFAKITNNPS